MSRMDVGKGHVTIEELEAIAKARAEAQRARGSLPYDEATEEKPVLLPPWVARSGLVAVLPKADELFLDVDNRADLEVMKEILGVLGLRFQVVEKQRTTSKSKNGHVHVVLKAPRELHPLERIALQACLGSDRKREALSLLRHMDGKYAPTVFFEVAKSERNGVASSEWTRDKPAPESRWPLTPSHARQRAEDATMPETTEPSTRPQPIIPVTFTTAKRALERCLVDVDTWSHDTCNVLLENPYRAELDYLTLLARQLHDRVGSRVYETYDPSGNLEESDVERQIEAIRKAQKEERRVDPAD